ncbi:hypothetical protein GTA08_BOTSDO01741 [Neofusicoccum parvum]|uniref:Uncharacterized protein n=1 Tax=Neofusicoccum parvum TaxID=310453 RepID=A0ACB5SMG9_9PEZI|nr:hypothetical protein GTA08_BOTSDO01741 [Neofusicoccum parvum]GME65116.1 hypothetical protein GTA08_BOTSDO01741 [Neofusicoccum parvum]
MIACLQNHELFIKAVCLSLQSYEIESGDPNTEATYNIVDKTTFKLTLTNVDGGVNSTFVASAPIGTLTLSSKWRAVDGKLKEDIEIDGNKIAKMIGKATVEKSHPEMQKRLIEEASKSKA